MTAKTYKFAYQNSLYIYDIDKAALFNNNILIAFYVPRSEFDNINWYMHAATQDIMQYRYTDKTPKQIARYLAILYVKHERENRVETDSAIFTCISATTQYDHKNI